MSSDAKRAFWEKAAITTLAEVLADTDITSGEATELATKCADQLTREWSDRFEPKGRKAVA